MLRDAVSKVWWLHLFLEKGLGAWPVLLRWDGISVGNAVFYWLYRWTGIEELGFTIGSAPSFSG